MAQPSDAIVSLPLTESQAAKIGLRDRWLLARKKILSRQRNKLDANARLQAAIEKLLRHAQIQPKEWSQRKLAKTVGLTWTSWRRCRSGKVNARHWLPKVEAALAKLKVS
jgi:hypothetical protein